MTELSWLETWPMLPVNCFVMLRNGTTMLMLNARPEMLTFGALFSRKTPPMIATNT